MSGTPITSWNPLDWLASSSAPADIYFSTNFYIKIFLFHFRNFSFKISGDPALKRLGFNLTFLFFSFFFFIKRLVFIRFIKLMDITWQANSTNVSNG